jgi:hypothetical protein
MGIVTNKSVHVLVVTGPQRDRLYERFHEAYAGRGDVLVVKDRRMGERRRTARVVPEDRRHADRRRSAPWMVFPPD